MTPSTTPSVSVTPSVTPSNSPIGTRYSQTLGWHATQVDDACYAYDSSPSTWYTDNANFISSSYIWRLSNSTSYPAARYFSNGAKVRYWNGSSFTSTQFCII